MRARSTARQPLNPLSPAARQIAGPPSARHRRGVVARMVKRAAQRQSAAAAVTPTIPLRKQRRLVAAFLMNERGWSAERAADAAGFSAARHAENWAKRHAQTGDVDDDGAARGPARKLTSSNAEQLGAALMEDKIGRGVQRVATTKDLQVSSRALEKGFKRVP